MSWNVLPKTALNLSEKAKSNSVVMFIKQLSKFQLNYFRFFWPFPWSWCHIRPLDFSNTDSENQKRYECLEWSCRVRKGRTRRMCKSLLQFCIFTLNILRLIIFFFLVCRRCKRNLRTIAEWWLLVGFYRSFVWSTVFRKLHECHTVWNRWTLSSFRIFHWRSRML